MAREISKASNGTRRNSPRGGVLLVSEASIIHALRQAGTKEALATSKLLKRGIIHLKLIPTDLLGEGVAGRYFFGSSEILLALDKLRSPHEAAGFVAHETRHYLQRITPQTYRRIHEFEAYQWQRATDATFQLSDQEIWQHIRNHPLYKSVPE